MTAQFPIPAEDGFRPGRLWSLWDMQRVLVQQYLSLGKNIRSLEMIFRLAESGISDGALSTLGPRRKIIEDLSESEKEGLRDTLTELKTVCGELSLKASQRLFSHAIDDPPETIRELALLQLALAGDLEGQLFLFVPSYRALYYEYDYMLSVSAREAFPAAYKELQRAGNCYATSEFTACVFHLMRAAEIGVWALGSALNVTFPTHPIELADWHNILDQADSKIVAMKGLPRGTHKDEELNFYSQAAVQFRYFKDAWRVRVAHARETYTENQAATVMQHTRDFFEVLAQRLKEQAS